MTEAAKIAVIYYSATGKGSSPMPSPSPGVPQG
jgi:hypothetical protein